MTARAVLPIGECGLLTRRNAMRWCGQIGEERFDREVAPRCTPRYMGQERFYDLEDLKRWRAGLPVDQFGTRPQAASAGDDWEAFGHDLSQGKRHQARPG